MTAVAVIVVELLVTVSMPVELTSKIKGVLYSTRFKEQVLGFENYH